VSKKPAMAKENSEFSIEKARSKRQKRMPNNESKSIKPKTKKFG